jgi:hypothetical protein
VGWSKVDQISIDECGAWRSTCSRSWSIEHWSKTSVQPGGNVNSALLPRVTIVGGFVKDWSMMCWSIEHWSMMCWSIEHWSKTSAQPGGNVNPALLAHAPIVGGLGEAEITVGHLRAHRAALSRAVQGAHGPLWGTAGPLVGTGGSLCPLWEGAGCSLWQVWPHRTAVDGGG